MYDFFIIFFEGTMRDSFSINLESFVYFYKVRRGKKSYFFSKIFPEDLGYHLAGASFSITSRNMEHPKGILRISQDLHEF